MCVCSPSGVWRAPTISMPASWMAIGQHDYVCPRPYGYLGLHLAGWGCNREGSAEKTRVGFLEEG